MPRGFQVGIEPKRSARLAYSVYAGELFRWNCTSVAMDINFEVLLEPPDLVAADTGRIAPPFVPKTEVVLAVTRIKSKKTNSGSYVAPRDGKVSLSFYNTDLVTMLERKQVKGDVAWFALTNKAAGRYEEPQTWTWPAARCCSTASG
jgi:hypothetical protein